MIIQRSVSFDDRAASAHHKKNRDASINRLRNDTY
jgi:hypothetical protein